MTELQQTAIDTVHSYIDVANRLYNTAMPYPNIKWTLRGTIAGTAHTSKNEINLNPQMLEAEGQKYIDRTPGHEVAHLVVSHVFGNQTKITRTGKIRRDSHGATWKRVMRDLDLDPSRCHNFESANDLRQPRRRGQRYQYACSCSDTLSVGPTQHRRSMAGARYSCRRCKSEIRYIGLAA